MKTQSARDLFAGSAATAVGIVGTIFIVSCASAPEHPLLKASDVHTITFNNPTPVLCFEEKDVPPKPQLVLKGKKGAGVGKNSAAADIDLHALSEENKALRAVIEGCKGALKP